YRHTWRDSPKIPPPEWRPNMVHDQLTFRSVTPTATSTAPIPLPQTLVAKPMESPTNVVSVVHHCTNSFQPGAVTCTSTPQQRLDKSTISGQGYMSMGLNVMEKH